MDVGIGRAVAPDRGRLLSDALHGWVAQALGRAPTRIDDYARALTHGSTARATYERLEFLGDRVLGLAVAEWLYDRFPAESEGALSKRFNALVTGAVCAEIARDIGVVPHLKLGKQARDDGAGDSDNVLGDVMEALIGAFYLDHGHDAARTLVRGLWGSRIDAQLRVPRHPKSALQEWAAANNRRPPEYAIVDKSGPGHAPRFTVRVTIGKLASAEATGTSKQEAETLAATTLLAQLGG